MKQRILFVDDEEQVLQGLRRMLRPMRHEWDMQFVTSGQAALDILEREPVDLVISDMRMPGMDGGVLLDRVRSRHPGTMRMILSGNAHQEATFKAVRSAQQFISKPCEAETLKATIDRAFSLRGLLECDRLRGLVSRLDSLPSLPALYLEIVELLQSPESSIQEVGRVVARDIGMTSKILQLVNSAFFGLYRSVSDPAQAVSLLGVEMIKALVLGVRVFSEVTGALPAGFSAEALWSHSLGVAACARALAREETEEEARWCEAFTSGLLHDAGKLVLATNLRPDYEDVIRAARLEGRPEWELEEERLGGTHAEVGGYLAGLWGLPDPIVAAVAFHHRPAASPLRRFEALTAVHAADALWNALVKTGKGQAACGVIDPEYVAGLSLEDRVGRWQEVCSKMVRQGDGHGE